MTSPRVYTESLVIRTTGKGTYEITDQLSEILGRSSIADGTLTVFVQHTSCSLIIMENADPTARRDLEEFFDRLVPENAPYFEHNDEGTGRHALAHPHVIQRLSSNEGIRRGYSPRTVTMTRRR